MHINDLPPEILNSILLHATRLNERHGVSFSFGLTNSSAPTSPVRPSEAHKLKRYVRGPLPPDMLRWDAAAPIRQVCWAWHKWALDYSLKDVYVRRWKGTERWAELPQRREQYDVYELINNPSGATLHRDPTVALRKTTELLSAYPSIAASVRRIWFHGFYAPDSDVQILSVLTACVRLKAACVPWTVLRHNDAASWAALLNVGGQGLESLELLSVDLTETQSEKALSIADLHPLQSPVVNFGKLKRLKLFGNTSSMPINDNDLKAIARTATALEEFHIMALSSVTIDGVMAIVKSSRSTLRVLEHSPRGDEGFSHPHPGSISTPDHICTLLTSCPRLKDLSISIPSMCPALFDSPNAVRWAGDCQVRATRLCNHSPALASQQTRYAAADTLSTLLKRARSMCRRAASSVVPRQLAVELFFAGCVFEPHIELVHGSFEGARIRSSGAFPLEGATEISGKGPYGSTGLYGRANEGN